MFQKNEGQAVIEFVLGLLIVISFFFFYIRMSALFAVGNYIHYATFMAARAYSSGSTDQSIQEESGRNVLSYMVKGKFKSVIKAKNGDGINVGPGPYYQSYGPVEEWNQGASYEFTSKLSLYPWSKEGQSIQVDLTSESWMPREQSETECKASIGKVKEFLKIKNIAMEWDNGC